METTCDHQSGLVQLSCLHESCSSCLAEYQKLSKNENENLFICLICNKCCVKVRSQTLRGSRLESKNIDLDSIEIIDFPEEEKSKPNVTGLINVKFVSTNDRNEDKCAVSGNYKDIQASTCHGDSSIIAPQLNYEQKCMTVDEILEVKMSGSGDASYANNPFKRLPGERRKPPIPPQKPYLKLHSKPNDTYMNMESSRKSLNIPSKAEIEKAPNLSPPVVPCKQVKPVQHNDHNVKVKETSAAKEKGDDENSSTTQFMCSSHDSVLSQYCRKCQVFLCHGNCIEDHNGHVIITKAEGLREQREQALKIEQFSMNQLKRLKQFIELESSKVLPLEQLSDSLIHQVKEQAEILRSVVTEDEQILLMKIQEHFNELGYNKERAESDLGMISVDIAVMEKQISLPDRPTKDLLMAGDKLRKWQRMPSPQPQLLPCPLNFHPDSRLTSKAHDSVVGYLRPVTRRNRLRHLLGCIIPQN